MKIAILAEQNFNLIDGSTIWLLNICKLLALQPDFHPVLVLSHPLTNRVLADELPEEVELVDTTMISDASSLPSDKLAPRHAPEALAVAEHMHGQFARVLVRGAGLLERLLDDKDWRERVVAYAPNTIPNITLAEPLWLTAAREARAPIIVQSEIAKQALESLSDYPAQIVHVVPPIVFNDDRPLTRSNRPISLCYSGKVDPAYGLDWLLDFCDRLSDWPDLSVTIIAGKDTYRDENVTFFKVMDEFRHHIKLGLAERVTYLSDLPHASAKHEMAKAHFAYCLRHSRYDDVIEISTKIVEFCTLDVPPILNDTKLNRSLFGDDYPYFIDILSENVPERLTAFLQTIDAPEYQNARSRIAEIAAKFSAHRLSDKLARAIRGCSERVSRSSQDMRRLLIATHERKFLNQFLDLVRGDDKIKIFWQNWDSTAKVGASGLRVPSEIDTIFCEWACENAVWHSHNKMPNTKLIVRLHRFEAFRDFPARVRWDSVDALIVVSSFFRDLAVQEYGVDPARVHIIPQYIDWEELQRPKTPAARFTLGLVGINPFGHKRLDRAVDFVAALRARDSRFQLAIRSVMPWQIDWVWNGKGDEKANFQSVFKRIFSDPLLKGAVRFDPAGPDMEEWYRSIGVILSSSDTEGCHTAVMEGIASGCDAVVHHWPGARTLFADHVVEDMRDAIDRVIAFADDQHLAERRRVLSTSMQQYDLRIFAQKLLNL